MGKSSVRNSAALCDVISPSASQQDSTMPRNGLVMRKQRQKHATRWNQTQPSTFACVNWYLFQSSFARNAAPERRGIEKSRISCQRFQEITQLAGHLTYSGSTKRVFHPSDWLHMCPAFWPTCWPSVQCRSFFLYPSTKHVVAAVVNGRQHKRHFSKPVSFSHSPFEISSVGHVATSHERCSV